MDDAKFVFLKRVPKVFIRATEKEALVTVPGDKASADGRVRLAIGADQLFASMDADGKPVPGHSNVRLDAGASYGVTCVGGDGNVARSVRTAEELAAAWNGSQRELAARKGKRVVLGGVSGSSIRESGLEMRDGSGRRLLMVSVADPESAPASGRDRGYGTFLVSPDAVRQASSNGRHEPGYDVYLGRESDAVCGYTIRTGETGADGRPIYEKAARTAGEVRDLYAAETARLEAGRDRGGMVMMDFPTGLINMPFLVDIDGRATEMGIVHVNDSDSPIGQGRFPLPLSQMDFALSCPEATLYLGYRNDLMPGYERCTGLSEDGLPVYEPADRTCGDIKADNFPPPPPPLLPDKSDKESYIREMSSRARFENAELNESERMFDEVRKAKRRSREIGPAASGHGEASVEVNGPEM